MAEPTDSHVSVLEYRVTFGPDQVIESDLTETYETDLFEGTFTHDGDRFRCEMREHFASVEEAREAVERQLRAWTIRLGLKDGPSSSIDFAYIGASVEDRSSDKPGHGLVIQPASMNVRVRAESVQLSPHRERFPGPPEDFGVTPTVDILWERFNRHLKGSEQLPSFAQYVFTAARVEYGGLTEAADALSLSTSVLKRLRRLSGRKGGPLTARKFAVDHEFEPLTGDEERWLKHVTRLIIRRLGEHAAGKDLELLTNDDLPSISGS